MLKSGKARLVTCLCKCSCWGSSTVLNIANKHSWQNIMVSIINRTFVPPMAMTHKYNTAPGVHAKLLN